MPAEPYQRRKGGPWHFWWHDADGKRRWGKAADRTTALLMLQERTKQAQLIAGGVITREQVSQAEASRIPIADWVGDFEKMLQGKKRSAAHVKSQIASVRKILAGIAAKTVSDVNATRVGQWLDGQNWNTQRNRSYNLKAIKAFTRWLSTLGVMLDPLGGIKAVESSERTRASRSLSDVQLGALLQVAGCRRLFYLICVRTGLRWRETARLRWEDIDAADGVIRLPAVSQKAKRADEIPLPADVAAELYPLPPREFPRVGRMFKEEPRLKTWMKDLRRAGIITQDDAGYVDDQGRRYDRKCLRLTFGTRLFRAGVDLRTAQRLMRHSDVNLTAMIYTDLRLLDLQSAAAKVSGIATPAAQEKAHVSALAG